MNIKLDGFKKIHSDKTHTTLEHESDGHQIKLAHRALSKPNRKALEKLPLESKASDDAKPHFDEGGSVAPKPKPDYTGSSIDWSQGPGPDGQYHAQQQPDDSKNKKVGAVLGAHKFGYADGGPVSPSDDQSIGKKIHFPGMATPFADGGDVKPDDGGLAALQQGVANLSAEPPAMNAAPAVEVPQSESQAPSAQAPTEAQRMPASDAPPAQPPVGESAQAPDLMQGYQNQLKGIQGEADAQANLGNSQASTYNKEAQQALDLSSEYQKHYSELDNDRKSFQQDILAKHIDPNHYLASMSTGKKIETGIALALGGLGGGITGQGNAPLQFLNNQIDRDIEAQKSELGKRENLLSANLRQFGNMEQATQMTRIQMHDMVQAKIAEAGAQAASPMAKANAMKLSGQLEQQTAPMVMQQATRRALMSVNSGQGGLSNVDPAAFIRSVVPDDKQKDVAKEIGDAQEIARNRDKLTRNFNEATQENTILKTGFGKLREPGSVKELKALILPQFKNIDGTVREYAAEQAFSNFIPAPGDSQPVIEHKRRALNDWMVSKQAAPLAKAYGIDLEKFSSTSSDQTSRLPAQQQSFAKWARENPSDPRSALILKKLGLE